MTLFWRPALWLALIGICLFALNPHQLGADAARLAATKAAQEEAEAKADTSKSQEEKERMEKLKSDIEKLLKENKEYKKKELKAKQEEEVAEFTPQELEETELWRNEYAKFMQAEKNKDWWDRAALTGGVSAAVFGGLAAFDWAHRKSGDGSSDKFLKGAGTAALLSGAGALIAWIMRRQNKKRQKLHNARLARMHFEARTGMKPSDKNVLGPDDDEILNPKKKKDDKKDDD